MKVARRVPAAAAALVVAGAIASGCGSNDAQNNYVDQINQLQVQLVSDVTDATAGATPSNPKQAAATADDLQKIFGSMADDLEAVEPPDEVADLHSQLVDKVRGISDQIGTAADAFRSGDAQQAAQAAVQLQSATTQAQTDLNQLIDQINSEFSN